MENYAGGEAYDPESPELRLYKLTINNLLQNNYYTSSDDDLMEVIKAFSSCVDEDPEFVLQLADYARNELGLRSISHVLLAISAENNKTRKYVREYGPKIMSRRADDPLYVLDNYIEISGNTSVPTQLRDAIEDALHTFNKYEYAKYSSGSENMNYKDLLNLVHPKPRDDLRDEIFESIINEELDNDIDGLEPPETWEVVISEKGNTKEAWEEVLDSMGLFATIRNFNNMLEAGLSGEEIVGDFDEDTREWVQKSGILPFRFYQSYRNLPEEDEHLENWLTQAIEASLSNLPDDMSGSLVAVDVSGSMESRLSLMSDISYKDISCFFGAVFSKIGANVYAFASEVEKISFNSDSVFDRIETIRNSDVGGATYAYKVLEDLTEEYDRLIFLTDLQIYSNNNDNSFSSCIDEYRKNVNFVPVYMVDLNNYGDLKIPEDTEKVYNINGWNDSIINFINNIESQEEVLEEIRNYR